MSESDGVTVQVSLSSNQGEVIAENQLVVLDGQQEEQTLLDLLFAVHCDQDQVLQHLIALETTRVRRSRRKIDQTIAVSSAKKSEEETEILHSDGSLIAALASRVPFDDSCPAVELPLYSNAAGMVNRHGWTKIEFTVAHRLLVEAQQIVARVAGATHAGNLPTLALPSAMVTRGLYNSGELTGGSSESTDELFEHESVAADLGIIGASDDHFNEGKFHYKRFVAREPLITQMLSITEFESLMNIFLAMLIVFLAGVLYDEVRLDSLQFLTTVSNSFARLDYVLFIWLCMFASSFGAVLLIELYKRSCFDTLGCGMWYGLFIVSFLIYPVAMMRWFELTTQSACIIACEQARLSLKIHAYFWETFRALHFGQIWCDGRLAKASSVRRRLIQDWIDSWELSLASGGEGTAAADARAASEYFEEGRRTPSPSLQQQQQAPLPAYLQAAQAPLWEQLQCFCAFVFFPCLVYRSRYPRTSNPTVDWSAAGQYALKFLGGFVFVNVLWTRFCLPVFQETATNPGSVGTLLTSVLNSTLPGCGVILIGFFSILHFWINMWSELTRFADKRCYDDWWASKTWAAFYRKWNLVVYDFLHNYFFLPLLEAGYSATFAEVLIVVFSALVYEYMLSLVLGFVFPVFLVAVCSICGLLYVPLTHTAKTAPAWNLVLWIVLYLQNGMCLVLYSREYYAREAHAAGTVTFDDSSWLPFSFQALLTSS